MYNYQKHVRNEKLQQKCEELKHNFLAQQSHRSKKNKIFVQGHKKRLDAFLMATIQKPIEIIEHRNAEYKPRELDPKKNISKKPFRMNFNTASERLKNIIHHNKQLDDVPFTNANSHQFRNLASSFNTKPIKFTPSSSIMRIYETLEKYQTNEIPYHQNQKTKKMLQSDKICLSQQKYKKYLQKSIMPSLNRKNHLNSLKMMYNEMESSRKDKQLATKETIYEKYDEDGDLDKIESKIKKKQTEHVSKKENAKDALIKCGILKIRKNLYSSKRSSR